MEPDEKRRAAAVQKIVRCLDHFLNGYADDGGCDEGPSYWGRAGASLFNCLELLYQASGGALNAFDQPLVRQIGLYICRAHIAGEWYTNFSDAPARVYADGDLIYRFGRRLNDDTMARHGAYAAFARGEGAVPSSSIGRELPALFNLAELRHAPRAQALLRDAWMPGIAVMTARLREGSVQGLYVAATTARVTTTMTWATHSAARLESPATREVECEDQSSISAACLHGGLSTGPRTPEGLSGFPLLKYNHRRGTGNP